MKKNAFHEWILTFVVGVASVAVPAFSQSIPHHISYTKQEIQIKSPVSKVPLNCTMHIPDGPGPHPAILLLGDGGLSQDGIPPGQEPLTVLEEFLSNNGYLVLKYDGRDELKFDTELNDKYVLTDGYADAISVLDHLIKDQEEAVSIIGYRAGSLYAGMIAGSRSGISNLLLLAPPVLPGDDHFISVDEYILRQSGVADTTIIKWKDLNQIIFKIIMLENSTARTEEQIRHTVENQVPWFSEEEQKLLGLSTLNVKQFFSEWIKPKMRSRIEYDPLEDLSMVDIPTLVIYPQNDRFIPFEPNIEALEEMIFYLSKDRIIIKQLENTNHNFQECQSCTLDEVIELQPPFPPRVLNIIRNWLNNNIK